MFGKEKMHINNPLSEENYGLGRKVCNGIYFLHSVDKDGRKKIKKVIYIR